jgi:hypothetical protein
MEIRGLFCLWVTLSFFKIIWFWINKL